MLVRLRPRKTAPGSVTRLLPAPQPHHSFRFRATTPATTVAVGSAPPQSMPTAGSPGAKRYPHTRPKRSEPKLVSTVSTNAPGWAISAGDSRSDGGETAAASCRAGRDHRSGDAPLRQARAAVGPRGSPAAGAGGDRHLAGVIRSAGSRPAPKDNLGASAPELEGVVGQRALPACGRIELAQRHVGQRARRKPHVARRPRPIARGLLPNARLSDGKRRILCHSLQLLPEFASVNTPPCHKLGRLVVSHHWA
jgi:hypothetical protein